MDVIVVASSEPGIQETLRVLLDEGHIIISVQSSTELANALVERPVDLVILDEFIDNVDCATVYKCLNSVAPETTCILLTVQTASEAAREMRAEGIYDIIAKPFDKDELMASVSRALERSRLQALATAKDAQRSQAAASIPPAAGLGDSSIVRRDEMLGSLRKFLRALTGGLEPGRLYEMVLETVIEIFSINKATLLLRDEKGQQMRAAASLGLPSALLADYASAPWSGIAGWLRKHDQALRLDDWDISADFETSLALRKEMALLQAQMCFPLVSEGRLVGALALGGKVTGKPFSEAEIEFLCLLSQQVASIIVSAIRQRDVSVQKKKFEDILQGVNSGLIATDSQGQVLVFNKTAEQILGLKAPEILGKSIQRVGSGFADIVFRSLREEKSLCRHEIAQPGTKALLGVSTSLLTDSAGKPIGAVALFTDLSAVSSQPATGEDQWQRCALCLAHEIKNPLVAIRTFAQLFPESYNDESFRDEFAKIVIKEIDKLDGVVERLMRFAQPIELRARPDDIHSMLEEEMAEMADEAKSRDIRLEKSFGPAQDSISFDRDLLKEAVDQVLDNALESMPSGGTLSISTAESIYPNPEIRNSENGIPPGKITEIVIADTGVGIPSEEMPNLFQPFHTKKLKGMGLGLAISRRIVRKHSGDILVSSTPDKGTTVKILLPHGAI